MGDISSKLLVNFISKYPKKSFLKGEIIIFQGESPRAAYVIQSGIVKAYNLSIHGDEKPVAFHEHLESFPGSWIYAKVPSSIYYYEAFSEECTLYLVPREEYVAFVQSHQFMALSELDNYVKNSLSLSMQLNALQHSRASEKLMYTLHYLALTHGRLVGEHQRVIDLHLTHQDYANLTGLTRETAATELNKLKHLGVISYGKNLPYSVNLTKLQAILNDQYIAELDQSDKLVGAS